MDSVFQKTNYGFLQSEDITLQVHDKYIVLVKDFFFFEFYLEHDLWKAWITK